MAAAVPYFLSIGESAQTQQRVREADDKTVNNQFALGKKNAAVNAGVKKGVVVGLKKSGVAAPAPAAAKKASPFSFGGAPKSTTSKAPAVAAPAPAAPKKTSKIPAFGPR